MKKLLVIFFVLISALVKSQTWHSVGTAIGTGVIDCDLAIDQANGDLWIAYSETATQRANVSKWNGTTWVAYGTPSFGTGTSMIGLKMQVYNGIPYVATKFVTAGEPYLRVYFWNGTLWDAMGSTSFQIPSTASDYSLKISSTGGVYLCFDNLTSAAGSLDLIVDELSATSQAQIGGVVSDSYMSNHDFVMDPNDEPWVASEYGDMTNYVNISFNDFPVYGVQDIISNDDGGEIVTNLIGSTDLRFAQEANDNSIVYTRYDLGTGLFAPPFSIFGAAVTDFDMASSTALDYIFYSVGTASYVESVNIDGIQTALGTNFMVGTGTITDTQIDTWSDRVVVACVRGNLVRVMELNNACDLTMGSTFGGCEQTLTTAPAISVSVSDNNYVLAGFSIGIVSADIATIPNANVSLLGTYPNYYIQFTSADIALNTNVELEIETIENSVITNTVVFLVDVVTTPNILIDFPDDEACANHGLINLIPHGSPAGGFWSGTGVNTATGKFNPAVAGPGTHVINYTYSNGFGCTNDDNTTLTVHPVPQITVSTTDATCGNDDGTANATITGGTPTYNIYWSNGSLTEDITDLLAGLYFINVTDQEGCQATKPATIGSNGLTISASITDALCPSSLNGAIDLTIVSGSGIQSIEWSNGATTEDVSGLPTGTYDVAVTNNDGCISTGSYTISAPASFSISETITPATCASADGGISLSVSGGTSPYNYNWFETVSGTPVGTNSPNVNTLEGGAYFAVITDDNGCSVVYNTMISETGGPTIIIDLVTPAGCADDGAIDIMINTDEPITSIEWSNGAITEDISALAAGFYTVEVINQSGCMGMGGVEVPDASPDLNLICLVTVDTLTNTNLIVWEKPIVADISHYNIYRETSVAGEYLFLDSVLYADESVYNDTTAFPQIRSWRYKITSVNLCGLESDQSDVHKTIHLTIGLGLPGTINLDWDDYEGFSYSSFDLYRHTTSSGWSLIQSLPSTNHSFTDTPPSMAGLDYMITVTPPAICTSTNKSQDHNSSRSNKTNTVAGPIGVNEIAYSDFVSVYPNPSTGEFVLNVNPETVSNYQVIVTDATGRIVMQFSSSQSSTIIDLGGFANGVYNLQLMANDAVVNTKLVKQ